MNRRFRLCAALWLSFSSAVGWAAATLGETAAASTYQPPAELLTQHPATYLQLAGQLWGAGKREDALFCYYVGQLRYRFHLLSNPGIDPSGDPALFASLRYVIGEPIETYAQSEPTLWASTIERVLKWDADHDNGFTSKSTNKEQLSTIRQKFVELGSYITSNASSLKSASEQRGIGFVGMRNGVYVEERRERMPKEWPPLLPVTTLSALAGRYEAVSRLPATFFFSEQYDVLHATSLELSVATPSRLVVIAFDDDKELKRKLIDVEQRGDAVVFVEERTPADGGLASGESTVTYHLRSNAQGDLVIQRDHRTKGQPTNKNKAPVDYSFTFWERAPKQSKEPKK
jgi:hypothetical protein